ncbi:PQQ-dependent sugar dehydrogenase [Litoribrevibacter euphylliae]|uniref:PQQ-dependent sugar dehydrogenase n=1 Tax=Litoribrevibacter euphylliae TaxID=1834034 RepID=A0ABV7HLE7_9GAMM
MRASLFLKLIQALSLCLLSVNAYSFQLKVIADSLDYPWGFAFLDEHSVLVTEKSGHLKQLHLSSGTSQIIANSPKVVYDGQGGLLDVILHPNFDDTSWVYLSYSKKVANGYTTAVARGRLQGTTLQELEDVLVTQAVNHNTHHYGSRLAFDEQGFLYVSVGDRGNRDRAQDLSTHMGKILRIHEDGRIPDDNPFVDQAYALPEIYSYGHRNPQGMVYDVQNKALWIHEHGPRGGDELNLIQAGANYGWPVITYGREYSGFKITDETHREGMLQPVWHWTPSIAPSGLTIYRGEVYPQFNGHFFIGALKYRLLAQLEVTNLSELTRMVREQGISPVTALKEYRHLSNYGERIRDVEVSSDGFLYLLTDKSGGSIVKLLP